MLLEEGARRIIDTCLNVKKGERVLIVTDEEKEKIGQVFFRVSIDTGGDAVLAKMVPRGRNGEEPPEHLSRMMVESDVVIAVTKYSITHTKARREACKAGARIASMPGIEESMLMEGALTADFSEIRRTMRRIHRRLKGARNLHLTTDLGTDLSLSIKGRDWITEDTGICNKRGQCTTLPAGEIFIAPLEGTAEGKLMVDAAFLEPLNEVVKVVVREGFATQVTGARKAVLEMNRGGREGRNVAEFGIGLNPKARITGNILEDEKVLGTVHIAFGDNSTFGGRVRCGVHVDAIIKDPSIQADNRTIMEKGNLKI